MRRFLGSAWFPFLTCLVLGGVTAAAYAMLQPSGADISNGQLLKAMQIAGWAVGPVIAVLSLLIIGILNTIRRIVRLRTVGVLHLVVVLCGAVPWLIFSWIILDEPRYTAFARGAIDFVGRPMLWGSLAALIFAIILSFPLFFPTKKYA